MALSIPSFLMPLILNLISTLPGLISQAEEAFKPGEGAKKKAFVVATAKAMLEAQELIKPGLMTAAQEAAILETVSEITDAVVSAFNTAKLFEAPAV